MGIMPHEFGDAPAPSRYFMTQALYARANDDVDSVGFEHDQLLDELEDLNHG